LIDSVNKLANNILPDVKLYFPKNEILHVKMFLDDQTCETVMMSETPGNYCRVCQCNFKVKFGTALQPEKAGYISSEKIESRKD